jgi:hypothetical protein
MMPKDLERFKTRKKRVDVHLTYFPVPVSSFKSRSFPLSTAGMKLPWLAVGVLTLGYAARSAAAIDGLMPIDSKVCTPRMGRRQHRDVGSRGKESMPLKTGPASFSRVLLLRPSFNSEPVLTSTRRPFQHARFGLIAGLRLIICGFF